MRGWWYVYIPIFCLAIYLHEKYNLKNVPSPIISEIFEVKFIEIMRGGHKYTPIIRKHTQPPPRDILLQKSFTEELALTLQIFKDRNYDTTIGGDMNIDLLKIKE